MRSTPRSPGFAQCVQEHIKVIMVVTNTKRVTENILFCGICGKGFNYKNQLEGHIGVHSEEHKKFCSDCGRGFASDRTLARHAVIHQNLEFKCPDCPKVFNAKEKLQCHWRGMHGEGFTSLCGLFNYKSPTKRQIHQTECTECGVQRDLKKAKKYPASNRNE